MDHCYKSHPGPSVSVGRSAPELDVFEALINPATFVGEVSQTMQIAPFDMDYLWDNTTGGTFKIETPRTTTLNAYHGGHYQQSCSALSLTDPDGYYLEDPTAFHKYSVEYMPSKGNDYDGYMYWKQDDKVNWMMNESGLQGNTSMDYSQRLVPREVCFIASERSSERAAIDGAMYTANVHGLKFGNGGNLQSWSVACLPVNDIFRTR